MRMVVAFLAFALPGVLMGGELLGIQTETGRVGRFPARIAFEVDGKGGPIGLVKRDRTITFRPRRQDGTIVLDVTVVDHAAGDRTVSGTLSTSADGAALLPGDGADPGLLGAANLLTLTPRLVERLRAGETVSLPGRIDASGVKTVTFTHVWEGDHVRTTVVGPGVELTTLTRVDSSAIPTSAETSGRVSGFRATSKLTAAE